MTAASRQTAPVLEKMYQFVLWLIPAVEKFPRSQKFLLGDRLQSTALDVLESLVDAAYTRNRWRAGTIEQNEIIQRIGSWIAHAEHANTWRLRHALFRGGWFDPLWEPDGPPVRVLRGGSWNNKPDNARSAKRNRNDTTNRNDNTGFRLASTLSDAGAAAFTDAAGARGSIHGPS